MGFDAHIETFQVLFHTQRTLVELIEPTKFAPSSRNRSPRDPTSSQTAEQLPTTTRIPSTAT